MLRTEMRNEKTMHIDKMATIDMVKIMNEENLDRLLADGWHVLGNGFIILGVVPDQLTELTETLDTKEILYRQLQRLNFTIWQN